MRYFVPRQIYRLVSIFFYIGSIVMVLCWPIAIAAQILEGEFKASLVFAAIASPILAVALYTAGNDAWRAARYCYRHFDYA